MNSLLRSICSARGTAMVLGLGVALSSSAAMAQSLADSMVTAYRNSPELAASRSNVKVFSERAVKAGSQGLLNIKGQASIEALAQSKRFAGQDTGNFPATVSLTLVQPLYTGGQVFNSTQAAESRISAQEAALTSTEQQVLLNTVTAYADVRRDEELVSISQNNVRVLTEQLRAANERFQVGEVTRTDVEQARARLATAHSNLATSQGQLATSRESYQRAVGELPGKLQPLPPLPQLPGSADEAVQMAVRDDPGVVQAELSRQAAGSDVRSAMGALLPQVSLQSQLAADESFQDNQPGGVLATFGVFVTLPIYTGGFNDANVREAQAVAEGASADITTAMRSAARNAGVSWAQLKVARANIEAGKLAVSAAQLAFEGVQEEAKVGARTTLDVLDAEQEVLNARVSLVTAQRDEYVAAYSLLASVGKLTVKHLGLDVGIVPEVASYYSGVRNRNFGYKETDDTVWRSHWRP